MKQLIIGGLIGSVVLFIWQFLSWALLGLHYPEMEHTPHQEEIMNALNSLDLEEGTYMLPTVPKGASAEEMTALQKNAEGKPWARISYRKSYSSAMGMNLIRGWVNGFIASIFLTWILLQFRTINMKNSMIASVGAGLIAYFTIAYLKSIWFEGNSIPDLIDAIVPWLIIGALLAMYLRRKPQDA